MPSPFNILFLMIDQQAYEMLRGNGWWRRPWRPEKIMPPNYKAGRK
jgi:hypothetical protein